MFLGVAVEMAGRGDVETRISEMGGPGNKFSAVGLGVVVNIEADGDGVITDDGPVSLIFAAGDPVCSIG